MLLNSVLTQLSSGWQLRLALVQHNYIRVLALSSVEHEVGMRPILDLPVFPIRCRGIKSCCLGALTQWVLGWSTSSSVILTREFEMVNHTLVWAWFQTVRLFNYTHELHLCSCCVAVGLTRSESTLPTRIPEHQNVCWSSVQRDGGLASGSNEHTPLCKL
jgi:hypothetical protein